MYGSIYFSVCGTYYHNFVCLFEIILNNINLVIFCFFSIVILIQRKTKKRKQISIITKKIIANGVTESFHYFHFRKLPLDFSNFSTNKLSQHSIILITRLLQIVFVVVQCTHSPLLIIKKNNGKIYRSSLCYYRWYMNIIVGYFSNVMSEFCLDRTKEKQKKKQHVFILYVCAKSKYWNVSQNFYLFVLKQTPII